MAGDKPTQKKENEKTGQALPLIVSDETREYVLTLSVNLPTLIKLLNSQTIGLQLIKAEKEMKGEKEMTDEEYIQSLIKSE